MACKRSGVRIPVAPLRSSTHLIRTILGSCERCFRISMRRSTPMCLSVFLQVRGVVRRHSKLPQSACISCKRSQMAVAIGAVQRQFSRRTVVREPGWEPSGFARTEHRFRKRTGGDADRCPGCSRAPGGELVGVRCASWELVAVAAWGRRNRWRCRGQGRSGAGLAPDVRRQPGLLAGALPTGLGPAAR